MRHVAKMIALLAICGCSAALPPLKTVERVDIQRFMGLWYVIASIPTFIETEAYNGVETYTLDPDGSINTVFTFNKGSFGGPFKRYNPRGFIVDRVNNSTWAMQFIWPFRAEYLITELNADFSQTIISRNKRDYVWIMARTPQIRENDYQRLVQLISEQGYDLSKLRQVPQQ